MSQNWVGLVLILMTWVESALGFRVLEWPGGSFRAFEVQTQQCVDRFWDPEFVSVFGIPLWTQPWRIPGPEGHVVSLGTWGSYLTRFVLIWGS